MKKIVIYLGVLLIISIVLNAQAEIDVEAEFAVFNLSSGDQYISDLTSKYLRTVYLYLGELVYPESYIKKVLEWKGLEAGDNISKADILDMAEKLEAKKAVYGSVKKSSNTYTISIKGIDIKTGEYFINDSLSCKGEYSLSNTIDKLVGLT
jgi:hypothetical protein